MESESGQEDRLSRLLEQAQTIRENNPAGFLAMVTTVHAQRNQLQLERVWQVELMLADALLLNGRLSEALKHCHRLKQSLHNGLFPASGRTDLFQLCIRCHEAMGQYEQALQYRQELLEHNDTVDAALHVDNLLGIARFYNQAGQAERALEFLQQAQTRFQDHALPQAVFGRIRSEQAQSWLLLNELSQAFTAMEEALTIWEQLGLLRERGEDLARLAAIHHAAGKSHQALEVLQQALLMLEACDCGHRMPAIHLQAARVHADLHQSTEACKHASTALVLAEKQQQAEVQAQAHQLLVGIYERQEDYRQALEHMRAFHALEQQIFSQQTHQRLLQLELDHALKQSEQEKALYQLKTNQLSQALREADQLRQKLEQQAHRDQLTKLYNRHYLVDKLNTTFRRSRKNDQPLCLVLADLDHFKRINDRFSHSVGDQVLMKVAEILQSNLRQTDVAGRYGGEEFLLILPNTDNAAALQVCEKLRACVREYDWSRIAPGLEVTISMGICAHPEARSHEELLQMADRFLYAAKNTGRNKVMARLEEQRN